MWCWSTSLFSKKWRRVFTDGSVYPGPYLWHCFTCNNVMYHPNGKIEFLARYRPDDCVVYKMTPRAHYKRQTTSLTTEQVLELRGDVFVVAKDWSWSFVQTHERDLYGPYFVLSIV